MSNDASSSVVDKRFYAAAASGAVVESFPSQDFYRAMRHRELQAYRSVIQSIVMHQYQQQQEQEEDKKEKEGNNNAAACSIQLSRSQQRLIEDLESELVIPVSRREIEIQDALKDITVSAVRTSGVAQRRPVHFDGIKDIPVENNIGAINDDDTDDDGAIVGVGQSMKSGASAGARRNRNNNNNAVDGTTTSASSTGPARPSNKQPSSKPLDTATANQLNRFTKEIPDLCKELVECSTPEDAPRKTQIEIQLRKLKNEVIRIREKAAANCASQG